MTELTQAELKHLLDYDPNTGVFVWKLCPNTKVRPGRVAGSLDSSGYPHIGVFGKKRLAHRLAWLYVHGRWPTAYIDHINGVRTDNRIANLRECTNQENKHNLHVVRGESKYMGVTRSGRKWQAKISVNNKARHLGTFDAEEDAAAAYLAAKAKLHPTAPITAPFGQQQEGQG